MDIFILTLPCSPISPTQNVHKIPGAQYIVVLLVDLAKLPPSATKKTRIECPRVESLAHL